MKEFVGYCKGVNLGGWLSQCDYSDSRLNGFIKEEDIKLIASWGVDHVRLPFDYNIILNKDYSFNEDGFKYIDRAIAWCKKYNLKIILDLHKTVGFSFDDGEKELGFFENENYQRVFIAIWKKMAEKYANDNDHLAFELLNEVTEYRFKDKWNELASQAINTIREVSKDVNIIVGGYYNNSVIAVKDIDVPLDEHIVYTFHCYEPLIFTHQGAYWIDSMDTSFRFSIESKASDYKKYTDKYLQFANHLAFGDSTEFSSDYFEREFSEAVSFANKNNIPLYCGEYGVINLADKKDKVKWYSLINKAFVKLGISRAAWSYREMDFGLSDLENKEVIGEIINKL